MITEPSTTPGPKEIIAGCRRPITVDEYHQMIDAGVFDEDEPLELLEGALVCRSPQSLPHADAIVYLNRLLVRALPARYDLRCQLPLTLARSEPEPDFAIVDRRAARRAERHPTTAVLVIEVAFDSLALDRAKIEVYAEAGVQEYWIVDVARRRVEVRHRPQRARRAYAEHAVIGRGTLASVALPSISVPVAALLRGRPRS